MGDELMKVYKELAGQYPRVRDFLFYHGAFMVPANLTGRSHRLDEALFSRAETMTRRDTS